MNGRLSGASASFSGNSGPECAWEGNIRVGPATPDLRSEDERQAAPPVAVLDRAPFIALCLFLVLALLTGGGSRPDVLSHIILRPAAVLFGAAAMLMMVDYRQLRAVRVPLFLLGALAAVMIVQLIPLPPSVWTALPGRELTTEAAGVFGIEQPWRPISLTPARTWNSLVSLFPPAAALLLYAALRPDYRARILPVLLLLIVASAVLGLAQRVGAPGGPLYLYRITNEGYAVGFFANRNHQAVMLACALPMLAVYASQPAGSALSSRVRLGTAAAAGIFLIPLILATGSRAGLAAGLIGLLAAGLLFRRSGRPSSGRSAVRAIKPGLVIVGIAAILVFVTVFFGQADALYRMTLSGLANDPRATSFATSAELARTSFPIGTGFGSFDSVYRAVEPMDSLALSYLNHAHNDLLQLVIEAGAVGLLLLAAFLLWVGRRAFAAWRAPVRGSNSVMLARLASVIVAILLLASLADYPLRTPFVMIVFALSLAWLGSSHGPGEAARAPAT